MKLLLALAALAGAASAAPIDEDYANRLALAIWHAEGGKKAKVSHGILSVKTRNPKQTCLNTITRTWDRWEEAGQPGDFVDYLGARYAPVGAKNDPRGLNKNWPRNVRSRLNNRSDKIVQNPASTGQRATGGASGGQVVNPGGI